METKKPRRKWRWIIILIGVVILIGGSIAYSGREKKPQYEFVEAKRGDLIQEVSVTGRVKPSESVDLSFEVGGKVEAVEADLGDTVVAGQVLVRLNAADLKAQLRQAQAGILSARAQLSQFGAALENQEARLAELKAGTRPEELQVAETAVYNAQKSWEDAKRNLETVQNKADVDLREAYNSALSVLPTALSTAKAALFTLTDVQYAHFNALDQDSTNVANAKAEAVLALLGGVDAGRWTINSLNTLSGGAWAKVAAAQSVVTNASIDAAMLATLDALTKVKSALEAVPLTSSVTASERMSLETEKSNVSSEKITISGKQQALEIQTATNQNLISSAESNETNLKNVLATARDTLTLKQAGYSEEQIRGQEAQVKQAKANIASQGAMVAQAVANAENIQAQIDKATLKAPIGGVVTKQEAKVGEIISPNSVVVSLISATQYKIEADIPEVDIAKVKIGDKTKVTLDAYGSAVEFNAAVAQVDPAETIIEGVPTYKTTFQFDQADDRIKSGMTANLDILTATRTNVIIIPQRAVIAKNGDRIARVLVNEPDPDKPSKTIEVMKEVLIKMGIRGSDGNAEILEGLKEGDKIITFIKN